MTCDSIMNENLSNQKKIDELTKYKYSLSEDDDAEFLKCDNYIKKLEGKNIEGGKRKSHRRKSRKGGRRSKTHTKKHRKSRRHHK